VGHCVSVITTISILKTILRQNSVFHFFTGQVEGNKVYRFPGEFAGNSISVSLDTYGPQPTPALEPKEKYSPVELILLGEDIMLGLSTLPYDLLLNIASYLNSDDIHALNLVSFDCYNWDEFLTLTRLAKLCIHSQGLGQCIESWPQICCDDVERCHCGDSNSFQIYRQSSWCEQWTRRHDTKMHGRHGGRGL
jgi:hypothetical protein